MTTAATSRDYGILEIQRKQNPLTRPYRQCIPVTVNGIFRRPGTAALLISSPGMAVTEPETGEKLTESVMVLMAAFSDGGSVSFAQHGGSNGGGAGDASTAGCGGWTPSSAPDLSHLLCSRALPLCSTVNDGDCLGGKGDGGTVRTTALAHGGATGRAPRGTGPRFPPSMSRSFSPLGSLDSDDSSAMARLGVMV